MPSTATGITKFRSHSKLADPHRLMRARVSHVNKVIKCAREQDNRGLYFVLKALVGKEEEEGEEAIKSLVKQEGIFVSNGYSVMY